MTTSAVPKRFISGISMFFAAPERVVSDSTIAM